MVTLRQYLDREGISTKEAAAALGVTPVHMSGVITGQRSASGPLKRLIWYWSEGAVGLEDWPDYEAPAAATEITPVRRPAPPPSYRSGQRPRRRAAVAAAG